MVWWWPWASTPRGPPHRSATWRAWYQTRVNEVALWWHRRALPPSTHICVTACLQSTLGARGQFVAVRRRPGAHVVHEKAWQLFDQQDTTTDLTTPQELFLVVFDVRPQGMPTTPCGDRVVFRLPASVGGLPVDKMQLGRRYVFQVRTTDWTVMRIE